MTTILARYTETAGRTSREREETLLRWSELPVGELLEELGTRWNGLDPAEARERLQRYGPNEIPEGRRPSWGRRIWGAFADPFIVVLLL
ncbi:MAG: hypothetical protein IRZ26_09710, partial [Clostridia bacterium]|nr:hypothetical protein [Clostridia bacterium]